MALNAKYDCHMSIVFNTSSHPPASLRGRQQDAVRYGLIEVGISLFLQRGFDATTIDMIAFEAGVSRRTVFRYFSTKEEIVIAWSGVTAEALAAAVRLRPADEPPLFCLCEVLLEHVAAHAEQHPAALAIGRLIEETPSLRARSAEKYVLWECALAEGLRSRSGADALSIELAPIAAAVAVGVFRVGAQAWINGNGAESLVDVLASHFSALNDLQRRSSLT